MEPGRPHPLATVDLFRGLDTAQLQELERYTRTRAFKAGQTVVEYQDDSHDVFFILSGKLKVTIFSEAGREIAFRELTAGQSFGELSAIDGQPRSANVIALTDATVVLMTASDFMAALKRHPDIAIAVLKKLTLLVRALSERVHEFAEKVEVRICHELLRLARDAMLGTNAARLRPAPKHAEIASRVNTHREAVSRLFSKLARQGIVQRGQGELVIRDVQALAAYARQLHSHG
ncbi:Crp/Fnr family transcriptional regulator [Benzoatithermus flavus]|uniref:Crp/Fnr family transcriptional regulator n=1 Tax=Benzoatithermus flavus TaxID=3108223 RepID=A0ABU8XMN9_9PROT